MASRTVARLTGTTATVLVTAAMAAIPLAGIANAAPSADDQNCKDFSNQQEAQQHYNADPSDPDGLDDDNDREACENYDYASNGGGQGQVPAAPNESGSDDQDSGGQDSGEDRSDPGSTAPDTTDDGSSSGSTGQVGTTPVGSVDAGDGSAVAAGPAGQSDDPVIFILGGFGALAATGAAAAVWNTRRSGTSRR
ncbi:excalibur calcium-binding domain-containing protein [Pseudonocardia sediminis]|uniref:Excalibur calcium-binding domain-containing protein n=1 Tax=Pseudonocardia sediminis TaxID=1397368 RepID=A0A4Q7URY8_PSEST|nr:calcium-binding protein [Pseudonocardia sediminis]RZT84386.1 excalibur calcium-binding domain-containing protein [Pseudonocardia sediminis]